jgi:glucosyl-3-phosphoglycerate synthase
LIIPLLASEFTDASNLPVFQNIMKQLKDATYLSQIIFGLDRASESDVFLLHELIEKYGIRNSLIQWNSGPGFNSIYDQLNEAGFHILEPGKGKNMFLSFGIAMALFLTTTFRRPTMLESGNVNYTEG